MAIFRTHCETIESFIILSHFSDLNNECVYHCQHKWLFGWGLEEVEEVGGRGRKASNAEAGAGKDQEA